MFQTNQNLFRNVIPLLLLTLVPDICRAERAIDPFELKKLSDIGKIVCSDTAHPAGNISLEVDFCPKKWSETPAADYCPASVWVYGDAKHSTDGYDPQIVTYGPNTHVQIDSKAARITIKSADIEKDSGAEMAISVKDLLTPSPNPFSKELRGIGAGTGVLQYRTGSASGKTPVTLRCRFESKRAYWGSDFSEGE